MNKIYSFYINLSGYDSISDALKARLDIYNVSVVGDGEMGTDEWVVWIFLRHMVYPGIKGVLVIVYI